MGLYFNEAEEIAREFIERREGVSESVRSEVEDFLYREAELLDWFKFDQWLHLLSEDLEYLVFSRVNVKRARGYGIPKENPIMVEDKKSLTVRVRRLNTIYAWYEDPPSRTMHAISNVRVLKGEREGEVVAKSYVVLYRHRRDEAGTEELPYLRRDVLRLMEGEWRIGKRHVVLIHSVIPMSALSNLY